MQFVIRFTLFILTAFIVSGCTKVFDPVYNFHPQEKQSFRGTRKPIENAELQKNYGEEVVGEKKEPIKYTWLGKTIDNSEGVSENVVTHHFYNADRDLTRGVKPMLNKDYSSIRRDIIYEYFNTKPSGTNFFEMAEPLSTPGSNGLDYSDTISSRPYNMKDPMTQEFVDDYYTPSYQKGDVGSHSGIAAYNEFLQQDVNVDKVVSHEFFYEKKHWKNLGVSN